MSDFQDLAKQLAKTNGEIMELKKQVENMLDDQEVDMFGHHLQGACDEAYEEVVDGFDKMLNALWHLNGAIDAKAKALDGLLNDEFESDVESESNDTGNIAWEWIRPDAAAIIAVDMLEAENKGQFLDAIEVLIWHDGWNEAWTYIERLSSWNDEEKFLHAVQQWHPAAYELIMQDIDRS